MFKICAISKKCDNHNTQEHTQFHNTRLKLIKTFYSASVK